MKKVLFVNSCLTGGGSERVMSIIANVFSNNNIETEMVLLREKGPDTYFIDNKIKCYRFHYKNKNKIIMAIDRVKQLRKIIKNGNYDYVISFMYDINITTIVASLALKTSLIISERNDPNQRKTFRLFKNIEFLLYNKSKKVVFQTKEVLDLFPKYIKEKSVVILNPIRKDLPNVHEGKKEKIIFAAGRLTEQKNFRMLINAFYEFNKIYPEFKLKIYGKGPLYNELKKQINEMRLNGKVELCGYIENLNEITKSYYMYISSSNYEGISNSMLEAIAMGIPSICTNCPVGGAAATIKDEENGILIPVNDEKALFEKMIYLVENKDVYKKISQNGTLLRETLSEEKISQLWLDLIQ